MVSLVSEVALAAAIKTQWLISGITDMEGSRAGAGSVHSRGSWWGTQGETDLGSIDLGSIESKVSGISNVINPERPPTFSLNNTQNVGQTEPI